MSSPGLAVENLSLSLGAFRLRHVGFDLAAGEILVILGPNGAGKSVTLETIAGFHRPETGRILIRGRNVTGLPPEQRNVGLLFQNFALFPHLTVAENVGFGLRARGLWRRDERGRAPGRAVAELLEHFGIAHLGGRHPQELSPGERQRAALARALATRPDLFLFDEPFSALDARTRDRLRDELQAFLRGAGTPAIFVTHDLADALTFADKILVMRHGEVVQSGAAAEIFRSPAEPFVAEVLGIENILPGHLAGSSGGLLAVTVAGDRVLHAAPTGMAGHGARDVYICIRAEDVRLSPPRTSSPGPVNRFAARLVAARTLGALCKLELDCGFRLEACTLARDVRELALAPGSETDIEIAPDAIHLVPTEPAPRH